MRPDHASERRQHVTKPVWSPGRHAHAIRVAARVLGFGTALLGALALRDRETVPWGIVTFAISFGAFWLGYTRSRGRMRRAIPFVVGGAMLAQAGLGFAGDLRTGYVLAAIAIGVLALVVGTLTEFPELLGGPRPPHRREVRP